jgi:hypothetical protein
MSQGRAMAERTTRAVERQRAASDACIRSVAADAEAEQSAKPQPAGERRSPPRNVERMTPAALR